MRARRDYLSLLLRAYPQSYRRRRGDEILDTLLEDCDTNSRYENLRVALNVVGHGLRLRMGIASDQRTGRVLVAAAVPGMAMVGITTAVIPLCGQVIPDIRNGPVSWGPDTAIWPGLCIVWILGCLASLVFPARARLFAAACIATTVIARYALPIAPWGLPSGLTLCIALALPCLVAPRTFPRWSHRRLALLSSAVVPGGIVAYSLSKPLPVVDSFWFYSGFSRAAPYVGGTVIALSVILLLARRWMQGSAIAVLAIPWLLLPVIKPALPGFPTRTPTILVAVACFIGAGLLALWVSDLWRSRDLLP